MPGTGLQRRGRPEASSLWGSRAPDAEMKAAPTGSAPHSHLTHPMQTRTLARAHALTSSRPQHRRAHQHPHQRSPTHPRGQSPQTHNTPTHNQNTLRHTLHTPRTHILTPGTVAHGARSQVAHTHTFTDTRSHTLGHLLSHRTHTAVTYVLVHTDARTVTHTDTLTIYSNPHRSWPHASSPPPLEHGLPSPSSTVDTLVTTTHSHASWFMTSGACNHCKCRSAPIYYLCHFILHSSFLESPATSRCRAGT